jgi:hypothetical protein
MSRHRQVTPDNNGAAATLAKIIAYGRQVEESDPHGTVYTMHRTINDLYDPAMHVASPNNDDLAWARDYAAKCKANRARHNRDSAAGGRRSRRKRRSGGHSSSSSRKKKRTTAAARTTRTKSIRGGSRRGKFKFENKHELLLDNTKDDVSVARFAADSMESGIPGTRVQILHFPRPVTVQRAVETVEDLLSDNQMISRISDFKGRQLLRIDRDSADTITIVTTDPPRSGNTGMRGSSTFSAVDD